MLTGAGAGRRPVLSLAVIAQRELEEVRRRPRPRSSSVFGAHEDDTSAMFGLIS